jgi:hypothetical protein
MILSTLVLFAIWAWQGAWKQLPIMKMNAVSTLGKKNRYMGCFFISKVTKVTIQRGDSLEVIYFNF